MALTTLTGKELPQRACGEGGGGVNTLGFGDLAGELGREEGTGEKVGWGAEVFSFYFLQGITSIVKTHCLELGSCSFWLR